MNRSSLSGREAVIVAAGRSAVGKAPRGTLRRTRPDDMAAAVLRGVLEQVRGIPEEEIDDVILGCAFPESEQGMNLARIAALRAGLPDQVSALTVNRFCASGLEAIALATLSVRCGSRDLVLAGGAESMSLVPVEGNRFSPNPRLVQERPDTYLSMGLTAENVATLYGINRLEQDEFSLLSHLKAIDAQDAGRFVNEIIPLAVEADDLHGTGKNSESIEFRIDEGPRRDTSLEALSALQPVFHLSGSVTAGNSSQRSDGAAAVVVASMERCRDLGLEPLGRLVGYATAGVAPEVMGIGPVQAVPKALRLAGIERKQVSLIELNEAFAAQAIAVIRELELDPRIVNVNGGAIALGHPLGATGAKLTVSLLSELGRRGDRFGIVTMCVGGGMGAAAVLENFCV